MKTYFSVCTVQADCISPPDTPTTFAFVCIRVFLLCRFVALPNRVTEQFRSPGTRGADTCSRDVRNRSNRGWVIGTEIR